MNDDYQSMDRQRRFRFHVWLDEVEDVECFGFTSHGVYRVVDIIDCTNEERFIVKDIFDGTEIMVDYRALTPLNGMEVLAAA